jgi:hypothetical protein
MILRHADFADEASSSQRWAETLACARYLDERLRNSLLNQNAASFDWLTELKAVLIDTNDVATKTGVYYSVAVAVKLGAHITASSIGHIKLWKFRDESLQAVIEPTIITLRDQPVSPALLTGTLGLGFDPERIQFCELELGVGDFAFIAMEADFVQQPRELAGLKSPKEVLERLEGALSNQPPIAVVMM